mgnify:CR=1 FL=1
MKVRPSASTWVRTKAAARAPARVRPSASTSGPARNRTVIIGVTRERAVCRAVRVCRPPDVDATTQPHDASYVPFAGAPGTVSAPTRSAARLFAGATCDGLTRRSAWFLHRDMRTRAGETAPGTGRSWACSSGCTTCADDKVAKRPHATRNGPAKIQVRFRLGARRLRRRREDRRCRGARRRNIRRDLVGRHARRRVSRERRDRRPQRRRRGRLVGWGRNRRRRRARRRVSRGLVRGRRRRPHRGRGNRRRRRLVGRRGRRPHRRRGNRRRRRLVAGSRVGGLSGRRRAEREERRHALSSDHRRDRTCVDNR